MKLSECLETADIAVLQRIAKHHQFSCSLYSKNSLLQEILFAFRTIRFLLQQVDIWRDLWPTAFVRLCMSGRKAFSLEEVYGMFGCDNQVSKELQSAMDQGLLYLTSSQSGRGCFVIPSEILNAMRLRLIERLRQDVVVHSDGPLTFREEGFALCRDLDIFLEYVLHHDVTLTTGGGMYKRNLQQILSLVEIEEQPLDGGGWRFGYGRRIHDYPDRFALLYDFAYQMGFIMETENGTLELAPKSDSWTNLSIEERQQKLIQFYLSVYRRPIPRLYEIMRVILHLSDQWVDSQSVLEAISDFVNKFYYDEVSDVWRTRIVKMMMHLGLLKVGEDESGKTWFQITKLGQQLLTNETLTKQTTEAGGEQRILMVQPNFDILVTSDNPVITMEIAKFAELKDAGAIRIYRITDKTVERGLAAGHSVTTWLHTLGKYAQGQIPGNVERTLREWEKNEPFSSSSLTS